ncbi:E3 ubiquitin-protein ligase TRIM56-like [Acanthaster planci]|uniref:E3 ubiquitin-protein ligase TRIM56-like n=1 Tax=Acanthaster planci TaxID=133434 RepID=A0A8B7XZ36_ACAPL|nr:E3 ubiquitin-protein ligase TRIM56-like [Acanthaster planci]
MAGLPVSAEIVLENISQGHLECPICCCRFNQPKILNCLHSFCKNCLEKVVAGHPDQKEITCPVCRQQTAMTETGLAGILNNFSLMALVEEVAQQEHLVKSQRSQVTCEECDEQEVAISRCLECREYLCDACHKAHQRSKKTKSHETASIDDLRSGEVSFESRLRHEVPKCQKHAFQDLIFYCQTCTSLICAACTALDHRTSDHEVCDVADALASCQEKVAELVQQAEQHLTTFKAKRAKAQNRYAEHKKMIAEKHGIIAEKADIVVARIRRNEQLLKEKVIKACSEQDKKFEDVLSQHEKNVKETADTLERVTSVMAQLGKYDLLKLQQSLCKNLQDAIRRTTPPTVWDLTRDDFSQSGMFTTAELDVLFKDKPLPVSEQANLMKVGTKVVRGPDWEWGNQDGYPPGEGVISKELNTNGWVKVRWDTRHATELNYRMGAEGKYDLQLASHKMFGDGLDHLG